MPIKSYESFVNESLDSAYDFQENNEGQPAYVLARYDFDIGSSGIAVRFLNGSKYGKKVSSVVVNKRTNKSISKKMPTVPNVRKFMATLVAIVAYHRSNTDQPKAKSKMEGFVLEVPAPYHEALSKLAGLIVPRMFKRYKVFSGIDMSHVNSDTRGIYLGMKTKSFEDIFNKVPEEYISVVDDPEQEPVVSSTDDDSDEYEYMDMTVSTSQDDVEDTGPINTDDLATASSNTGSSLTTGFYQNQFGDVYLLKVGEDGLVNTWQLDKVSNNYTEHFIDTDHEELVNAVGDLTKIELDNMQFNKFALGIPAEVYSVNNSLRTFGYISGVTREINDFDVITMAKAVPAQLTGGMNLNHYTGVAIELSADGDLRRFRSINKDMFEFMLSLVSGKGGFKDDAIAIAISDKANLHNVFSKRADAIERSDPKELETILNMHPQLRQYVKDHVAADLPNAPHDDSKVGAGDEYEFEGKNNIVKTKVEDVIDSFTAEKLEKYRAGTVDKVSIGGGILEIDLLQSITDIKKKFDDIKSLTGGDGERIKNMLKSYMRERAEDAAYTVADIANHQNSSKAAIPPKIKSAFKRYTGETYEAVNDILRGKSNVVGGAEENARKIIRDMDKGFIEHGLYLPNDTVVYRAESRSNGEIENMRKGESVTSSAYSSATLSSSIAGNFSKLKLSFPQLLGFDMPDYVEGLDKASYTRNKLIMSISSIGSIPVIVLGEASQYPEEAEIILPRNLILQPDAKRLVKVRDKLYIGHFDAVGVKGLENLFESNEFKSFKMFCESNVSEHAMDLQAKHLMVDIMVADVVYDNDRTAEEAEELYGFFSTMVNQGG